MKHAIPRLVISATHKSAGKTTVTVGLAAAMADKGLAVQPFKKGPDYIDPMWLTAAAGRDCRNLDNYLFGWDVLLNSFKTHASKADIALIEGNKGLHDSVETGGEGSTANLARKLHSPVVMVMDASGTTRGIAPLLLGYKMFEPDINIAGIILNKVGSARHESKLRAVVEEYCKVPVLGALRKSAEMEILERHLGLIPVKEDESLRNLVGNIRRQVAYSVDIDTVIAIARAAAPVEFQATPSPAYPPAKVRIAVMMDRAFTFYYPENLEALRMAGAELVPVDGINDARLPERIDALYIGGGFPETSMDELQFNACLRRDIRSAIDAGLPVHAECGGLIYLSRSVTFQGKTAEMVGALDCEVVIRKKPKGHGYMVLEPTGDGHWMRGAELRAHEFHYGEVVNNRHGQFACRVKRGAGIDGKHDGIVYKNVVAGFAHLHVLGSPRWALDFVSFAERAAFSRAARVSVSLGNCS